MTLLLLFGSQQGAAATTIIAKVERMLHARLVEPGGVRVDAFSARTNPTRDVVLGLINDFASLIYMRTGALDALTCERAPAIVLAAQVLIAQRVALEIELSYWPEEVAESAAASATERRTALETDLVALVDQSDRCRADSAADGGLSQSRSDPAWSYPVSTLEHLLGP